MRKILADSLPADIREKFLIRCEHLVSQLNYFDEKGDERLRRVRRASWTTKKLRVLLVLNAFYQIVLAPLASSARPTDDSFVSRVDVVYGSSFVFDAQWRTAINRAYNVFTEMVFRLGITERFLTQQRTEDILYRIGRTLDDHD
ncbi:MAG TPA: hypothetical protein VG838_06935 [Opitutaceae bacterium]|nr:hypothetical protein [Opitutaceae bacterium]